jgi:hypothetical protein
VLPVALRRRASRETSETRTWGPEALSSVVNPKGWTLEATVPSNGAGNVHLRVRAAVNAGRAAENAQGVREKVLEDGEITKKLMERSGNPEEVGVRGRRREERQVEGDEHGKDAVLGSLADTCAHGRGFQAELGGEDADKHDDRDL